jgi:hypothetical protein
MSRMPDFAKESRRAKKTENSCHQGKPQWERMVKDGKGWERCYF